MPRAGPRRAPRRRRPPARLPVLRRSNHAAQHDTAKSLDVLVNVARHEPLGGGTRVVLPLVDLCREYDVGAVGQLRDVVATVEAAFPGAAVHWYCSARGLRDLEETLTVAADVGARAPRHAQLAAAVADAVAPDRLHHLAGPAHRAAAAAVLLGELLPLRPAAALAAVPVDDDSRGAASSTPASSRGRTASQVWTCTRGT